MDNARILAPVRYAAWLAGDLGNELVDQVSAALGPVPEAKVTKLPRGLLIEAAESPGPLLEQVAQAMRELEKGVANNYPIFHKEMGPVWTGTLQAVFP